MRFNNNSKLLVFFIHSWPHVTIEFSVHQCYRDNSSRIFEKKQKKRAHISLTTRKVIKKCSNSTTNERTERAFTIAEQHREKDSQHEDRQSLQNVVYIFSLSQFSMTVALNVVRSVFHVVSFQFVLCVCVCFIFCSFSCYHIFLLDAQAKKPMTLFSHQLNSFILSRRSTCDPNRRIFTAHQKFIRRYKFGAFYNFVHICA